MEGILPLEELERRLPRLSPCSPLYMCDEMAYKLLNDAAVSLPGLSGWVERKKQEGKLWCISNSDGVTGWNEWTPCYLGSDARNYMIYFLRLLGLTEATPAIEDSMLTYIYTCCIPTRPKVCYDTVFVTGNEELFDAFTQAEDGPKKIWTFVEYFFGDMLSPCKGPVRVWPVFRASESDTQPVEECLDSRRVRLEPHEIEEGGPHWVRPEQWRIMKGLPVDEYLVPDRFPSEEYIRELFRIAKCNLEVGCDGHVHMGQYYIVKENENKTM